ncbi:MAG: hypothetical protein R3325_06730 [Thermoanaerobaculia bacterium]|nr:hypothetical protein [Thermoanaerobaculia bacterium]
MPFGAVDSPVHVPGWENGAARVRVLAPLTLAGPDGPALPDFESTSQNTNGHSVLLRIDYGNAQILLTGDLNKNSMHYLLRGYADHETELRCDLAKACHHGSHDISYRFLSELKAGATVISSGDSEGYGHPRPEVVGASATTGHVETSADGDRLITPLIYSTEVERGVSLGIAKVLAFSSYPSAAGPLSGALFRRRYSGSDPGLRDRTGGQRGQWHQDLALLHPLRGGVDPEERGAQPRRPADAPPGAVRPGQVRTNGELVLCATQTDSAEGWVIHAFKARPDKP